MAFINPNHDCMDIVLPMLTI